MRYGNDTNLDEEKADDFLNKMIIAEKEMCIRDRFEEGLNLVQDLDTQLQGYENKVQELMLRHQPKESQDENL